VWADCLDVLEDPPPATRLMAFGDYGLQYELRVWSTTLIHRKGVLISNLNRAIYTAFREQGIEIPYPQLDLWLHGEKALKNEKTGNNPEG